MPPKPVQRILRVLTVAAVLGREFTIQQLNAMKADISEERLIKVLDEALSARVVEELPDAMGRYQFTHAMTQKTLLEELTVTRKVKLHAGIAEALEELYGGRADRHAAELVTHFSQAETVLGKEKVARYSLMAGRHALEAHAFEDALGHFQRGIDAKADQPMDDESAELLFGLARASAALNQDMETVGNLLTQAFEYYEKTGDAKRAVDVWWIRVTSPTPGTIRRLSISPGATGILPWKLPRFPSGLNTPPGSVTTRTSGKI